MHMRILLALTLLLTCLPCSAQIPGKRPDQVLFVGNSLTYVGNLPAVFAALANANGHPVRSDMIVRGGATLNQRVQDGSVVRALSANHYTTIVLQERGGDLLCAQNREVCAQSQQAIESLAKVARNKDVNIVLMGTYQGLSSASRALVEGESRAAARAGIAYVEVSEKLQRLRRAEPGLGWFQSDGMHPGTDLVLLDAIVLYKQLFGSDPEPKAFTVNAPIYTTNSRLTEALRAADATPPRAETPGKVSYSSVTVQALLAGMSKDYPG